MYGSRWGELLIGSLKSEGWSRLAMPFLQQGTEVWGSYWLYVTFFSYFCSLQSSFLQIALDDGIVLFPDNGCVFLKYLLFFKWFDQMKRKADLTNKSYIYFRLVEVSFSEDNFPICLTAHGVLVNSNSVLTPFPLYLRANDAVTPWSVSATC